MNSQSWYRLDTDSSKNPYAFIDHRVTRVDGKGLEYSDKDGMPCILEVGRKRLLDLAYTMGGAYLFSDRAKRICASLRIQDEIVWSPVEIKYGDKTTSSYWAVTCWKGIEALDTERSELKWLVPGKVIGTVNRWVLDNTRLPAFDLFVLEEKTTWIVSRSFRNRFEEEGLTGAAFQLCDVYP